MIIGAVQFPTGTCSLQLVLVASDYYFKKELFLFFSACSRLVLFWLVYQKYHFETKKQWGKLSLEKCSAVKNGTCGVPVLLHLLQGSPTCNMLRTDGWRLVSFLLRSPCLFTWGTTWKYVLVNVSCITNMSCIMQVSHISNGISRTNKSILYY